MCQENFGEILIYLVRRCSQSEYQRNGRESQRIITVTIEETIRKLITC